jgi:hypothetical protein
MIINNHYRGKRYVVFFQAARLKKAFLGLAGVEKGVP